ncbi:porin family protein [Capnocytophaga gingivalis]|uniref:Porin family protein n=1 Tax=Capnocytophaga gingivalis TaxID=1017 RepID=A0ABU5ZB44_9FLAO|nr:porin family protein [Capnocytophaga gingivalis]MEB3076185.1 porin family protein [Capnocytophaga gingivalis]
MKKILMTVAFAALAIAGANAQVKFGVRAGLNHTDQAAKEYDIKQETVPRISFHVGALVEYAFNDVVLMDAGLTYSNQGYKTKIGDGKVIDYTLNLPVWFKYDFAGFRPKAGIYAGYILSQQLKGNGNSRTVDSDSYNHFDYGIGLGAEYNLPNNGLFFEASYNSGLANLKKNGDAKNYENNRVIQVGIGYKF